MSEFVQDATKAGFTRKQAEFMEESLAKFPHTHTAEEITDFEEAVAEIPIEDEEEGEP